MLGKLQVKKNLHKNDALKQVFNSTFYFTDLDLDFKKNISYQIETYQQLNNIFKKVTATG